MSATPSRPGLHLRHELRNMSHMMPTKRNPGQSSAKPSFGQNLREARLAAGITQSDLAYDANVDRSAISLYEQCHREPNLRTVLKLARVLKIEASELVRGL